MNAKQIGKMKREVCTELNKMGLRYDTVDVSFDIKPTGLVLTGVSDCLKDLSEREDASIGDYEIVVTQIRLEIQKKY